LTLLFQIFIVSAVLALAVAQGWGRPLVYKFIMLIV
jgi:hypothetical protein